MGALRPREGGAGVEVFLQLEPGEAVILRAVSDPLTAGPLWEYHEPAGPPHLVHGEWHVEIFEGGPVLPPAFRVDELRSWTVWPGDGEALRDFSGTARYRISFPGPAVPADAWVLDLGRVCHSARVRLNGRELGTLIAPPFRLEIPDGRWPGGNVLEVEITNLMANRIASMDRRGIPWRKFLFVNLDYGPFDASAWEPLPSGLLGPVRLIPLRHVNPRDLSFLPANQRSPD